MAQKRSDVPPERLKELNAGRAETRTLVEWLAMDLAGLFKRVLKEHDLPVPEKAWLARFAALTLMKKMSAAGEYLASLQAQGLRESLAKHSSDSVREWAAMMIPHERGVSIEQRIEMCRPFAADGHMGVREMAWMAFRPHLAQELAAGLKVLENWAGDENENIRRAASEGSRPRGVWCAHLRPLRERPELGLAILEPLKSDASLYVRRSVGNWLNDASKDNPAWVRKVCKRWAKQSPAKETIWVTRRALRTVGAA